MRDYKKMFYILLNETEKTIEGLQRAQRKAKELYTDSEDSPVKPVQNENDETKPQ